MDTNAYIGIGIGLLSLVFVFFLILGIRRKLDRMLEDMKKFIRHNREKRIIGPERANYSGAHRRHGRVKGLGVIALTDQNIHFKKITGATLTLSRDRLVKVEIKRAFNGEIKAGRPHLVFTMDDGNKIGFRVKNEELWLNKLGEKRKRA